MFEIELQYYAALIGRDYCGVVAYRHLNVKEIQKVFDMLAASGIYYDEFLDILYPESDVYESFCAKLEIALEKLGVEVPKNYRSVVRGILRYHLTSIIENKDSPLGAIFNICSDLGAVDDFERGRSEIVGEIGELIYFCHTHWDYFELGLSYDYKEGQSLEKDIIKAAKMWLEQYKI